MAMSAAATSLHTHSVLLNATIPAHRYDQVSHILTGLCGHPPMPLVERHMLFRPATEAKRAIAADEGGGTQNVVDREKLRRRAERVARERGSRKGVVRYVEEVDEEAKKKDTSESNMELDGQDEEKKEGTKNKWTWRFYDTPDPNVKTVTARKSESLGVSNAVENADDALKRAADEGYRFVAQYALTGSQFVYNNIILLLHRPLVSNSSSDPANVLDLSAPNVLSSLKPLDDSGAYLLEARLEISDDPSEPASNDLINQGVKEMTRFKGMMEGCVNFQTGERMSFNTRI